MSCPAEVSPGIPTLKIESKRGDTYRRKISFSNGGIPTDLSGYDIKLDIRKTSSTRTPILTFDSTAGTIDMTDSVNGIIYLVQTATAMEIKAFVDYVYDLQITNIGNGEVSTEFEGLWTNIQDITS